MAEFYVNKLGFMMDQIARAAEEGNVASQEQLEQTRHMMQYFTQFSAEMQNHYQKVINDLVSEQQNQEVDFSYCIDVLKDNMRRWHDAKEAMEDQLARIPSA